MEFLTHSISNNFSGWAFIVGISILTLLSIVDRSRAYTLKSTRELVDAQQQDIDYLKKHVNDLEQKHANNQIEISNLQKENKFWAKIINTSLIEYFKKYPKMAREMSVQISKLMV